MNGPGLPRVVLSGVDSLYLFGRHPVREEMARQLFEAKEAAAVATARGGALPVVELGGHRLVVQPQAARTAPLLLRSEHLDLTVNPRPPRGLPTLMPDQRPKGGR